MWNARTLAKPWEKAVYVIRFGRLAWPLTLYMYNSECDSETCATGTDLAKWHACTCMTCMCMPYMWKYKWCRSRGSPHCTWFGCCTFSDVLASITMNLDISCQNIVVVAVPHKVDLCNILLPYIAQKQYFSKRFDLRSFFICFRSVSSVAHNVRIYFSC